MIAYCGLTSETCPIYLATRMEDKSRQARMRLKIARLCKKHYGMNVAAGDIGDCDGCQADSGRLFFQCKDCPIRNCAREKQLENCAYCPEYACDKLEAFFRKDLTPMARLDSIRAGILLKR